MHICQTEQINPLKMKSDVNTQKPRYIHLSVAIFYWALMARIQSSGILCVSALSASLPMYHFCVGMLCDTSMCILTANIP